MNMLQFAVNLDSTEKTPLYIQLYNFIKNEIITGNLEPNTKLPSIRQLALGLNMSRTTIEATYHQLAVEGYIKSEPKVGYFVSPIEINKFVKIKTDGTYMGNMEKEKEEQFTTYDFRSDYVDKEAFDFSLWKKYINKALKKNERFLSYGSYQGEYELRKEIAKYIHQSRGVICTPEQIVVGAGVQSLLHVLCAILKPGHDSIGFEEPGFKKGQRVFRDHNFKIVPIRMENDGIDINYLSESGTKIVYVSPSHQFPMGSTMPINKRIQLLNWAHSNKGIIIEDDYDSELRYFGRPIPSLQGLNNGANVVYMGTFSKILLPSLRISYMVLPQDLLEQFREEISQYNQTSSKIEQIALSLFMRDGLLEKHIRKLRKLYARKNQLLIDTIKRIMGDRVDILGKETGLHILLAVKISLSLEEIVLRAEQAGVKVIPVSNSFTDGTSIGYPLILLSYGGIPREHIEPAIKLLNKVWFQGFNDGNS